MKLDVSPAIATVPRTAFARSGLQGERRGWDRPGERENRQHCAARGSRALKRPNHRPRGLVVSGERDPRLPQTRAFERTGAGASGRLATANKICRGGAFPPPINARHLIAEHRRDLAVLLGELLPSGRNPAVSWRYAELDMSGPPCNHRLDDIESTQTTRPFQASTVQTAGAGSVFMNHATLTPQTFRPSQGRWTTREELRPWLADLPAVSPFPCRIKGCRTPEPIWR